MTPDLDIIQFFRDYGTAVTIAVTALAALGVGTIFQSLITARSARRDLSMRRRVETVRVFLDVSARAHGERPDGTLIGPGERIAAIYLLADLGARDEWLRHAVAKQLEEEHITMPITGVTTPLHPQHPDMGAIRLAKAFSDSKQHLRDAYRFRRWREKAWKAVRRPRWAFGRVKARVLHAQANRNIKRGQRRGHGSATSAGSAGHPG